MASDRRWYAEPQTFIALAALVVSVSAVVVGLYETSLQRHHDRAEVWPHTEIEVFTKSTGATLVLSNTGIGPAIIHSVIVTVDGQPRKSWKDVFLALNGVEPVPFSNYSAVQHALRPGDQLPLFDIPPADQPKDFWKSIGRVGIQVCYASVFDEYWVAESKGLGTGITWRDVERCPPQPSGADF